jgi:hypothetical protein
MAVQKILGYERDFLPKASFISILQRDDVFTFLGFADIRC